MNPAFRAIFDEQAKPTHASKRDVHDQIAPVIAIANRVQQQVITFRGLIAQAEVSEHDAAFDTKLEMMHQTFGALEREAGNFTASARNVALSMTQLERYMTEWQGDVQRIEAAAAPAPPAPTSEPG